jgi:NAD(P)H-flavin reductase
MMGKDILYIAGGCGLAPVRSSITWTLRFRANYGKVFILYGCKNPRERLFVDDLAEFRGRSDIAFLETVDKAEPGWTGNEGVITTLMPKAAIDPSRTVAIVCGPPVMYKFVIAQLQVMKVSAENTYVSLERHMKCGVGKCGHCQINGVYCCQDGPVFRLADVRGLAEAL